MELTDKVLIDNLCSWPLYFRRLNGVGDIRIPENGGDDVAAWKMDAINKLAESVTL